MEDFDILEEHMDDPEAWKIIERNIRQGIAICYLDPSEQGTKWMLESFKIECLFRYCTGEEFEKIHQEVRTKLKL